MAVLVLARSCGQVPENLQFFGTTSRRSFEVEPSQYAASFQWKTPGPGAYEERRHTFKKKNGQGGRVCDTAALSPTLPPLTPHPSRLAPRPRPSRPQAALRRPCQAP